MTQKIRNVKARDVEEEVFAFVEGVREFFNIYRFGIVQNILIMEGIEDIHEMRAVTQDAHGLGELVPCGETELLGTDAEPPPVAVAHPQDAIRYPLPEKAEHLALEHVLDPLAADVGEDRDDENGRTEEVRILPHKGHGQCKTHGHGSDEAVEDMDQKRVARMPLHQQKQGHIHVLLEHAPTEDGQFVVAVLRRHTVGITDAAVRPLGPEGGQYIGRAFFHGREPAHDLPERPGGDDGKVLVAIQIGRGAQEAARFLGPRSEGLAVALEAGRHHPGEIVGGEGTFPAILNGEHGLLARQERHTEGDAEKFDAVLVPLTGLRRIVAQQLIEPVTALPEQVRGHFPGFRLAAQLVRHGLPEQGFQRPHGHPEADVALEALLKMGRSVAPAVDLQALRKKEPCFHKIMQLPVLPRARDLLADFKAFPADDFDGFGEKGGGGTTAH